MKFKVGDVVKSKFGGPKMTIRNARPGYYGCVWFDSRDALHEHTFAESELMLNEFDPSVRFID